MGKKILGLDISSGDPSRGGTLEVGDYACPSCASSVSFSLPEYCGQLAFGCSLSTHLFCM